MFRAGVDPSMGPAGKPSKVCAPRHMTSRAHLEICATVVGGSMGTCAAASGGGSCGTSGVMLEDTDFA
jgi:hypothetical protein